MVVPGPMCLGGGRYVRGWVCPGDGMSGWWVCPGGG